ncbi:MAG: TAXI family TRAP transporter solute-binding subunit [Congregibacter sp.]
MRFARDICKLGLAFTLTWLPPAVLAEQLLRLHAPFSQTLNFPALSSIIEEETGIRLRPDLTRKEGDDPLESLADGSADLAIVENTRGFQTGVRTVLPLYRGVVHMAARQDFNVADFIETGRLPRVQFPNGSSTAHIVAELLFERAEVLPPEFETWRAGDAEIPDIIIYVGPINPANVSWLPDGFTLFSITTFDAAGAEFYIDGISFLVPQLQPIRIPALTYKLPGNQEGIDTLAVDMLLVASKSVEPSTIYALTKTLLEQKARFAATEPGLFRWLSQSFDNADFAFPLHRGARQYFERDQPGFLERYAETLNFLVYMLGLMITGLVALGRWRARRRKDRIDGFYVRVIDLRRRRSDTKPEQLLDALQKIENEAFEGLIDERLAADDSFRIFTDLASKLRADLNKSLDL